MATHVGANTAGGNLASIAPAWPANTLPNDVAFIFWTMQNTATPNVPAGFSAIASNDVANGSSRLRVLQKVLTATESGTITLNNSGAVINRQSACIVVYRGLNTVSPLDQVPVFKAETVSGTTTTPPSITTANQGTLLTSVHERATSITTNWTPPTGYTERADTLTLATGSGGSITAVADDLTLRAAGTYTPPAWTSNSATATANRATYTLSLREAVGAAAPFQGWGLIIG